MRLRFLLPLLSLFAAAPAFAEDAEPLVIQVGESRELRRKDVKRVALGDSSVADVETKDAGDGETTAGSDGVTLVVKGLRPGKTKLLIWTAEGRETVSLQVKPRKATQ
ncbi:MAG TPA: pilus assembly protein N-terminal domain-containing protein [Myxococcaceae bacterium]|nr:pilus assembly protein N-terminal domain-containing protein [Myxococcaceae bacterium]